MVKRDSNAAWTAIAAATVDDEAQEKGFADWTSYARACNVDPWLRGYSKHSQQEYLLAFAARVRTGIFGRAVQVGYQSVEKALRHVAQTLVLAGYDDPRKTLGSEHLDLPFQRLLRSYRHDDPVPKPQLALPVNTVEAAGIQYQAPNDARTRAAADLVITAFFFLLRVGEYTMPQRNVRTRTVQFRVQDVTFRRADITSSRRRQRCRNSLRQHQSHSSWTIKRTANVAQQYCTQRPGPGSALFKPWPGGWQA